MLTLLLERVLMAASDDISAKKKDGTVMNRGRCRRKYIHMSQSQPPAL